MRQISNNNENNKYILIKYPTRMKNMKASSSAQNRFRDSLNSDLTHPLEWPTQWPIQCSKNTIKQSDSLYFSSIYEEIRVVLIR